MRRRAAENRDKLAPSHLPPPEAQDKASYRLKLAHWKGRASRNCRQPMSALGH